MAPTMAGFSAESAKRKHSRFLWQTGRLRARRASAAAASSASAAAGTCGPLTAASHGERRFGARFSGVAGPALALETAQIPKNMAGPGGIVANWPEL